MLLRVLVSALILVGLNSPADAQSVDKILKDAISGIGKQLEKELGKVINPYEDLVRQLSGESNISGAVLGGTCFNFDRHGRAVSSGPCVQVRICPPSLSCYQEYRWATGNRNRLDLVDGKASAIDGAPVGIGPFAKHAACFQNQQVKTILCFDEKGPLEIPPVDQAVGGAPVQEQGQNDATAQNENPPQLNGGEPAPPNGQGQDQLAINILGSVREEDVEAFFSGHTQDSLHPAQALKACETRFLNPDGRVVVIATNFAVRRIRDLCAAKAIAYVKRIAGEIEQAFAAAVPLEDSSEVAIGKCRNHDTYPRVLSELCAEQLKLLAEKTRKIRCGRAIAASGASRVELARGIETSGPDYENSSIERVLCIGANNRPDVKVTFLSSWMPLFGAPRLIATADQGNGATVFDVELELTSSRGDRSFLQLLWDIATGENEKTAIEGYRILRVRAVDVQWRNIPPRRVIGCALGFIQCP